MRYYPLLLALLALAGCATAAQRQAEQIGTNTQATGDQFRACVTTAYYAPESASFRLHVPFDIRDATLQQMTSTAKITDEEIQAIYVLHPRVNDCRKTAREGFARTTPSIVPLYTDTFNRGELALIDLIERKVTWGEYVTGAKARNVELNAKLTAAFQQIGTNLQQSHQAEMANRQN